MSVCPTLAPQALQLATKEALKGRDTALYRNIYAAYDRIYPEVSDEIPEASAVVPQDIKWIEDTNTKNAAERTKLEVALSGSQMIRRGRSLLLVSLTGRRLSAIQSCF